MIRCALIRVRLHYALTFPASYSQVIIEFAAAPPYLVTVLYNYRAVGCVGGILISN